MHAVLPDGLVRGHGRRVVPRTWPHTSDAPESFAPDVKHAVHTEARQPEAVAAEVAAPPEEQPLVPAAASLHRGGAPLPGAQALAAAAAAQDGGLVPSRHPTYRLAFTVPWLGRSFPSWFPYFVASCGRSAFLVDWLIFHEDAQLPAAEDMQAAPNVIFHNLGRDGLSRLFGTRIAAALHDEAKGEGGHDGTDGAGGAGGAAALEAARLVSLFRMAFREFSYIVTEYKPTHGIVFAEYLRPYSHWSYTDIDLISGDLPLHIELSELRDYDIFTYHFGDVFRLYLRGQFAAHRNAPHVNSLWTRCPHLGRGLVRELEAKQQVIRRLAEKGKRGRTRFISAEGCYSAVVADAPGLRVKFVAKAMADWSDDPAFYAVSGALRKCADHGVWHAGVSGGHACRPFGPRIAPHSVRLLGAQRPLGPLLPLRRHANCSRWVEARYRVCANLSEEEAGDFNVMLRDGAWVAQRFTSLQPAGSLEGAFLHLQRWKSVFKKMRYGSAQMPRLRGRSIFRITTRGFTPLDFDYSEERGADDSNSAAAAKAAAAAEAAVAADAADTAVAAVAASPPPQRRLDSPARLPGSVGRKPLQEIVDVAEFEAEVLRLAADRTIQL